MRSLVQLVSPLRRVALAALIAPPLLLTMAAQGDGCAANSKSEVPDVTGRWDIAYDDAIDVTIKIGGAVYKETVGASGGAVTIDHQGQPFTFDLDCARPEIVCPSEAWPAQVSVRQDNAHFQHRMIVTLPMQTCSGELVQPAPGVACGLGTDNPECEPVCEGDVVIENKEAFGAIGETGETFRLFLGAGIATNGINCALLAASVADANLETVQSRGGVWEAVAMNAGQVTTAYAGACLWAGDPDADGNLEALVLSASVELQTGFAGTKR